MDEINTDMISKETRNEIIKFINNTFVESKDKSLNLKYIKDLAIYLNKNNLNLSSLDCYAIILESDKLYESFDILKSTLDSLKINNNINLLIEAYLNKKDDALSDDEIENQNDNFIESSYNRFTKGGFDTRRFYRNEISKIDVLTQDEEIELCEKIKNGDIDAYNKLVEHNLRLVYKYAYKYSRNSNDFDDLIQDGNLGLMKAAEKFDSSKGFKFSTYATWWIKQSMKRGITCNSRTIRIPTYLFDKMQKVRYYSIQYLEINGYEPLDEEIMIDCKISEKEYEIIKKEINNYPLSLNAPVTSVEDSDSVLGDFIVDDNYDVENIENKLLCETLINEIEALNLNEKEKNILYMRFGIGFDRSYTLEEVAKVYGVTRERIRQIEAKTLRKIRVLLGRKKLSFSL